MRFLKNISERIIKAGSFFGSTPKASGKFIVGIGESEIKVKSIRIWKYPFEPATIYPEKEIRFDENEPQNG